MLGIEALPQTAVYKFEIGAFAPRRHGTSKGKRTPENYMEPRLLHSSRYSSDAAYSLVQSRMERLA